MHSIMCYLHGNLITAEIQEQLHSRATLFGTPFDLLIHAIIQSYCRGVKSCSYRQTDKHQNGEKVISVTLAMAIGCILSAY